MEIRNLIVLLGTCCPLLPLIVALRLNACGGATWELRIVIENEIPIKRVKIFFITS
jgi:hypothetical protein